MDASRRRQKLSEHISFKTRASYIYKVHMIIFVAASVIGNILTSVRSKWAGLDDIFFDALR
jgi:hypothetical protein